MAEILLTDDLAADSATAAANRGCTQEDLASAFIQHGLHQDEGFALTASQQSRLLESIAQSDRGEVVDGNLVMARFDDVLQRMTAK